MIIINEPFIVLKTLTTSLILEIKDLNDTRTEFNKNFRFISIKDYILGETDKLEKSQTPHLCNGSNDDYLRDNLLVSSFGNGNNLEPTILLKNPDNTSFNRFNFISFEVLKDDISFFGPKVRNKKETLKLSFLDEYLNIELNEYISLCDDSDVITIKREIINHNKDDINILRAYSLELSMNSKDVTINTYDGAWLFERSRHQVTLNSGVFSNSSFVGHSSHKHNPYIEIKDNTNGKYYALNILYSGNHVEKVEVDPAGHTNVMVGINDFDFDYLLKPEERFVTPEVIVTLANNYDELTTKMHDFISNHVVNPLFSNKLRPIIFNSWEGCGMNINDASLVEMAEVAHKVGIEQFVMDDGWFNNRVDSHGGLGDWFIDTNKFPNTLKSTADKIRKIGMNFGLWVEPEMICINSDLYRNHPEYAMRTNREPIERRHQLMIDMANDEVVNYLFDSLSKVIDEVSPSYIKWDFNRFISDPYSKNIRCGEYQYRFMMGTYKLIDKLLTKYPNILFESCASGGGRYDLGMFYYMPQCWGSDDTNTYCRSFITCGTLKCYPKSTFGAHVSRDGCPIPGNKVSSLEDRFNLNCIGAFGYEMDLRKYNEHDLDVISKQIKFYKEHRELLQFGDYYLIDDIFDNNDYLSFINVSKDKKEAILFIEETRPNAPKHIWKVKGLDESKIYELNMREQYNLNEKDVYHDIKTGKELMEEGIDVGSLFVTTDKDNFLGVFSRLIYIKEK